MNKRNIKKKQVTLTKTTFDLRYGYSGIYCGVRSSGKRRSVRTDFLMCRMHRYINEPETVIETIKEFEINSPSELSNLKFAGVNPLIELGLMEE